MKKIYKNILLLFLILIFFSNNKVYGATASTLKINSVGNTTSQITAYGDPNSKVELHYGKYASKVTTLGTTDQSGYLTVTISTTSYNISCDKTAYVVVNGQISQTIPWSSPNNTTCSTQTSVSGISLNENNIVMNIGQSKSVTINGNGRYSISNNINPVISASIVGSTINLHAGAFGGSNITVCEDGGKCAVLYVVAINNSNNQECVTTQNSGNTQSPTTNTVVTPAPINRYIFSEFLGINSIGTSVTELQKHLTNLGYYSGPITGNFGVLTEAAVKRFQKSNGIIQVGYVGPSTRSKLNQL